MSRYRVDVLPGAITDVRVTYLYLLGRSQRIAANFQARVREAFAELDETGHQYQIVEPPLRRLPLRQFPHGVYFEIRGDLVVVHAVAHPRQHPSFWRERAKLHRG